MKDKFIILIIFSTILSPNFLLSADIVGEVKFKSPPEKIQRFNPYQFGGAVKSDQAKSPLENVVIYIDEPSLNKYPSELPKETPTIIQKNQIFIPHILPIVVGTEVDFPNLDPFYHNVFSLSKPKSFDLGRYPPRKSKKVRFDKPGIVKVYCEIHSDMSAIIIVLENSFFTKPDENGKYKIQNVPSGPFKIVAWHENFKPISKQIDVPERGIINVNFVLE